MNKKGFTLVEVLVSLALVSTIAIFLFQIIFIIRDIYAEKNIKSEIYIESSNISNVINKDIFNKEKDDIYIKNINKVSNDELYITYSDGTKNNIVIDRSNNTITYGNYTASILDVAKIGNIEMYYNYETTDLNKNGICYIKIPITHDDYKNDFGIVITYRYNSSKTKINGEITIRPGGEEEQPQMEICHTTLNTEWTFDYTGNVQDFTVPCSGTYKIELWGSSAADNDYSRGAYTSGNIQLSTGSNMYIYVGSYSSGCKPYTSCTGLGYNGGASGGYFTASNYNPRSNGGGGATDIRYFGNITPTNEDLVWNSSLGLNSRIMVAAGGAIQGAGGGLIGYAEDKSNNQSGARSGGTQTSGGTATSSATAGTFGVGGTGYISQPQYPNCNNAYGGGGGYYGGGGGWGGAAACNPSHDGLGGGGSSFISGHEGCLAIASGSTTEPRALKNGCTSSATSFECSKHYSGLYFTNTQMIDGKGCKWTTEKTSDCNGQPQPDGTTTIGHAGNGYAKITFVSAADNVVISTPHTFEYTGNVQTYTVPTTGTYKLEVWGAAAGSVSGYSGGKGAYAYGETTLEGNTTLYVGVGGAGAGRCSSSGWGSGGYNGGGSGHSYGNSGDCGSGGGGATHIGKTENLLKDTAQADVYLVAGGGGGTYRFGGNGQGGTGGAGGTGGGASYGQGGNGGGDNSGGGGGGWSGGRGGSSNGAVGNGGTSYVGGVTDGETIAGNASMPTHDGTSTMTGNGGNGYAKITLVSY